MTGPWRTSRGSIALVGVMGLVLLSLLLAGFSRQWSGVGTDLRGVSSSTSWNLDAWDTELPSLPPQAAGTREHHVLSLWPPLRGERDGEAAHPSLQASPRSGTDAVRDPQQFAHRTAGSRSPPLT
ncbi:hypothetical protein [Sphaerisporangium siamense]|uniref:Uncharacterized protein n=1 Tax=Sphaerisporangium siamense TaxID=795645 RepID=A0A7W7D7V1_9ACTN|nr:hypothetical protein [Sphaerisporangium siamense]MBB4701611.1 hypothetical protein [Sphaerisporangium siamense]